MRRHLLGFVVSSALAAPAMAAAEQPVTTVVPLAGPYPSLHSYCQSIARSACTAQDKDEQDFACELAVPGIRLKNPVEPYRQVRIISTGCLFNPDLGDGWHFYRLAIQTAAGWFASEPFARGWTTKHCAVETQTHEFALRDVIPGGAPEVVLRLAIEHDCGSVDEAYTPPEQWLLVAGIGASGKPSATRGIPLNESALPLTVRKRRHSKHKSTTSVTWNPDGTLQLGASTATSSPDDVPSGTYRLIFP